MSEHDVDGLNAGYARLLLEDYLENPDAVPPEWRELFESGDSDARRFAPGLLRLLETLGARQRSQRPARAGCAAAAPRPPLRSRSAPAAIDETLVGGVAAAMALVKAHRMHGHLAARLDPLGSEPLGDPALDETRLVPPLTPELQERIPANAPARARSGRDAEGGAAESPRRLQRHDGLRDRAPLRSRGARLAAAGDRVEPLPAAARTRGADPPARARSVVRRGSSSTCAARSSARSSSRSKGSTR